MVLNPRGLNDKYEVEREMEMLNSMKPIQFADNPQGRFLSEIRDYQLNVRSASSYNSPCVVNSGQAIGQTTMYIPQVAPEPFAPPPPPIEVYRAEDEPEQSGTLKDLPSSKTPAKTTGDAQTTTPPKAGADIMKSLGEWPIAPIVIGGVIVLVFYGLYRVMKKK